MTLGAPAVQPATAGGPRPGAVLFRRGFRPFFLGGAVHAALVVPVWVAIWLGAWPAPAWLPPAGWHGHEMLFGLVAAAIAGFLLTATPVWTGRTALSGRPLAALFGLWLAGRAAMAAAGVLPAALVAAADLAFLPALAFVLARTVWGTGQWRNLGVVALVAVLALANAALHAEAVGLVSGWASRLLRLSADAVVVLIVVIGGRITPAFTRNALLGRGVTGAVRSRPWLDRATVAAAVAVMAADLLAPASALGGTVACAAGALVAARLAGWQTARTLGDPLLWSLHVGTAWVALGLLLAGAGVLSGAFAPTAALHALTAGAMGSMILAVMTRVALGHTGRPLVLPAGVAACYGLVHAGAAARVLAALVPGLHAWLLAVGGALWAAAFAWFAVRYAPILLAPRSDGRDG